MTATLEPGNPIWAAIRIICRELRRVRVCASAARVCASAVRVCASTARVCASTARVCASVSRVRSPLGGMRSPATRGGAHTKDENAILKPANTV